MKKSSYKDLIVWQKAMTLIPKIYTFLKVFPPEERYALSDQVSIAANIAEGQGRNHPKEFLQFLGIAKGSLAELETLMIIARNLNYLTPDRLIRWTVISSKFAKH